MAKEVQLEDRMVMLEVTVGKRDKINWL